MIIGIIIIVYLKRKLKHRSKTFPKVNTSIQEQGEQRSLQDSTSLAGGVEEFTTGLAETRRVD